MQTDKEFDEFVRRQVSAKAEEPKFDPAEELSYWLNSLEELYRRIASFLATYISSKQIQLEFRDIDLNEDFSGPYKAKQMVLRFGRQEVTLTPIGTMLIGSRGRIDVRGPAGAARLVLVNKKATSARSLISVTVHVVGTPGPPKPKEPIEPIEWEWKIVSAPPALQFTPVTRDAFLKMILEVANG